MFHCLLCKPIFFCLHNVFWPHSRVIFDWLFPALIVNSCLWGNKKGVPVGNDKRHSLNFFPVDPPAALPLANILCRTSAIGGSEASCLDSPTWSKYWSLQGPFFVRKWSMSGSAKRQIHHHCRHTAEWMNPRNYYIQHFTHLLLIYRD